MLKAISIDFYTDLKGYILSVLVSELSHAFVGHSHININ